MHYSKVLALILLPVFFFIKPASAAYKDTVKTVALYSSTGHIYTSYPVDSSVYVLNKINTNKSIVYCTSTNDNTVTGFRADYLVDLDCVNNFDSYSGGGTTTTPRTAYRYEWVRQPDGRTIQVSVPYIETVATDVKPNRKSECQVSIKIIGRKSTGLNSTKIFTQQGPDPEVLELLLSAGLISYLHKSFEKAK